MIECIHCNPPQRSAVDYIGGLVIGVAALFLLYALLFTNWTR